VRVRADLQRLGRDPGVGAHPAVGGVRVLLPARERQPSVAVRVSDTRLPERGGPRARRGVPRRLRLRYRTSA